MEPEAEDVVPNIAHDQLALDILLFRFTNSNDEKKPCIRLVCLIDAFIAQLLQQVKILQPKLIEETSKLPITQYLINHRWAIISMIQSPSLCKDSVQLVNRMMVIMENFEHKNTEIHELIHTALMTSFLVARGEVAATEMHHPVCKSCYRFHLDWRDQFLRNEKRSSDE
jgi:hypothetical protein